MLGKRGIVALQYEIPMAILPCTRDLSQVCAPYRAIVTAIRSRYAVVIRIEAAGWTIMDSTEGCGQRFNAARPASVST
jgi:hypothetical protein